MTWSDVTIEKFQMLKAVPQQADSIGKACYTLSALYGKPLDYFESLPLSELLKMYRGVSFINEPLPEKFEGLIKVGNRKYIPVVDVHQMTGEQFILLQNLSGTVEESITNLHKIMAVICKEKTLFSARSWDADFENKSNDMLQCPITKAWPCSLFFFRLCNTWHELTQTYLEAELTKQIQRMTPTAK